MRTLLELTRRFAAVMVAAVVVLVAQFNASLYGRPATEYQFSGWPAVSCVYDFGYGFGRPGQTIVFRDETQRSGLGYGINGLMLLAIVTLVSMVDHIVRVRQFALWRLLVIMLACGVALACLRAASSHNAAFLQTCRVPIDSPKPASVLIRFH